jgi:acetylornithine deacetylase/succinyl-diaminopimelate desuccinylase-like protein
MGLGLSNRWMHSPNENFPIANLQAGIDLNQAILRELG